MAVVTVRTLAKVTGLDTDTLLQKFAAANLPQTKADDEVTDEQRQVLTNYLQGRSANTHKISLKRKSVGELSPTGSNNKAINIEVRKKRTYVRHTLPEEPSADTQQQIAQEAAKAEDTANTPTSQKAEDSAVKAPEAITDAPKTPTQAKAAVTESSQPTTVVDTPPTSKEVSSKTTDKEKQKKPGKAAKHTAPEADDKQKKGKPKTEKSRKSHIDIYSLSLEDTEDDLILGSAKTHTYKSSFKRSRHIKSQQFQKPTKQIVHEVTIPETIIVSDLAQKMAIKATEVIKTLMKMGVISTINQTIDQETAILVVEEMGHTPIKQNADAIEQTILLQLEKLQQDGTTAPRAPIVTIVGHVDHGKTSLLDYIRRTKVTTGEAGGITQHIGAYHVETNKGMVTFLDTPGHEAFTAMRARGVNCTDIVILVVAADDGVMPQTKEAIQHAKAAEVPIVVAVNKIDKPEADPDKIRTELSQYDIIPEAWGGENMFVNVSAKKGTGIDDLLESILLQAEVLELKSVVDIPASGVVIESHLDQGRGPVATVLVQTGTLQQGDIMLAGNEFGKIRAMLDEKGKKIKTAGPSIPTEVQGLSGTPFAGDQFIIATNEKQARTIATLRQTKQKNAQAQRQEATNLNNLFERLNQENEMQELNIIFKADVQGSVEALSEALVKLSDDKIKVNIIIAATGGINESDINLALASKAVLFGFNVRTDNAARKLAMHEKVDIRYYSIIYDAIDDIKQAIKGMLPPETREEIIGIAEVRDIFKSPKFGLIAGCMVIDGIVKRNYAIRVLRDNVVIYEGQLESLRRFKEDASEVRQGMECGIGVRNYNDVKVGDQVEVYETITTPQQ